MSDFQRAVEMSPNDTTTLRRYSTMLRGFGRTQEATAVLRKSIELDPLSASSWNNLGYGLYGEGDYAGARRALLRALEISPAGILSRYNLGITALLEGDAQAALAEFARLPENEPFRLVGTAVAEYSLGHQQQSQVALDALLARPTPPPVWVAAVYSWRKEPDRAFEWLARAREQRDVYTRNSRNDPLFANIRRDPRFPEFLKAVGLPVDNP
jgi:tetratricopeptide (TPR) repeat protein